MPTGRSTQITKQRGEYLVAAELARHDLLVATFSGNVPDFDLIAVRPDGSTALVQVKAITGPSWQLKIDDFAVVEDVVDPDTDGKQGLQILKAAKKLSNRSILWVLIKLVDQEQPKYWVLRQTDVQKIVVSDYKAMLKKNDGRRPKQWRSHHTAIWPKQLAGHEDQWTLITTPGFG